MKLTIFSFIILLLGACSAQDFGDQRAQSRTLLDGEAPPSAVYYQPEEEVPLVMESELNPQVFPSWPTNNPVPQEKTVYFYNSSAEAISFLEPQDSESADFSILENSCQGSLEPQKRCHLTAGFHPVDPGTRTSDFTLVYYLESAVSGANNPYLYQVFFQGNGE